jgi:hypothetical protein
VTESASIRDRFFAGRTFEELLAHPKDNSDLWHAIYRRATLSPESESESRAKALKGHWHLLILTEDWCGDGVNTLPYVARLAECCSHFDMRILGRDDNPDLMNAHLTGKSRSIPIVIVYDLDFIEKGWWGPRPGPLQQWVMSEGLALPRPDRYRHIRAWYARDRGQTTVSELLDIMERLDA